MAFLFYPAVAVATGLVSAATYVWFKRPVIILRAIMRLRIKKAGMAVKYEQLGGTTFCYAERGTPSPDRSSIIFVHGFTSAKDSWLTIIEGLPQDQHVVAVDLLGHGESSLPAAFEHASVQHLTDSLHKFLDVAGLVKRPVHMVGTSMGGLVAEMYTADHPDDIQLLTLICPAVFTPIKSKYRQELQINPDKNLLLARNVEDMRACFDLCLFKKNKTITNNQLLKAALQLRENKMEFYTQLSKSIHVRNKTEDLTVELAARIHKPTQIIWGENDELIDVSGAEYLRNALPDCRRVDILPECGHAVAWDQPARLTAAILAFHTSL
jgi:abhydrolase domain-containing protein 6